MSQDLTQTLFLPLFAIWRRYWYRGSLFFAPLLREPREGLIFWTNCPVTQNYTYPEHTPCGRSLRSAPASRTPCPCCGRSTSAADGSFSTMDTTQTTPASNAMARCLRRQKLRFMTQKTVPVAIHSISVGQILRSLLRLFRRCYCRS